MLHCIHWYGTFECKFQLINLISCSNGTAEKEMEENRHCILCMLRMLEKLSVISVTKWGECECLMRVNGFSFITDRWRQLNSFLIKRRKRETYELCNKVILIPFKISLHWKVLKIIVKSLFINSAVKFNHAVDFPCEKCYLFRTATYRLISVSNYCD